MDATPGGSRTAGARAGAVAGVTRAQGAAVVPPNSAGIPRTNVVRLRRPAHRYALASRPTWAYWWRSSEVSP